MGLATDLFLHSTGCSQPICQGYVRIVCVVSSLLRHLCDAHGRIDGSHGGELLSVYGGGLVGGARADRGSRQQLRHGMGPLWVRVETKSSSSATCGNGYPAVLWRVGHPGTVMGDAGNFGGAGGQTARRPDGQIDDQGDGYQRQASKHSLVTAGPLYETG
jgi:hypothetical protein